MFGVMAIAPILVALSGARAASMRRRSAVDGLEAGRPEPVGRGRLVIVAAVAATAVGVSAGVGSFGALAGTRVNAGRDLGHR